MISVEDCVDMEKNNLYNYVENSNERLLMAVKDEKILGEDAAKRHMISERDNIRRRHYIVNLREQLKKLRTRIAGIG